MNLKRLLFADQIFLCKRFGPKFTPYLTLTSYLSFKNTKKTKSEGT